MNTLKSFGILILGVALAAGGYFGYQKYQGSRKHKWISEIARDVDAQHAGKDSGFLVISMACQGGVPGTQGIMYAYGKFDLNLETGEFRKIETALPPAGFTCPVPPSSTSLPPPSGVPGPPRPPISPSPSTSGKK